mgnify:CR=1 FL=1
MKLVIKRTRAWEENHHKEKVRMGSESLPRFFQNVDTVSNGGGSLSYGEIPDLTGLPGIHIEVKRVERLNVSEAMKQAVRDSTRFGGIPTLFHRRNYEPWFVTMRLTDWLKLYGEK